MGIENMKLTEPESAGGILPIAPWKMAQCDDCSIHPRPLRRVLPPRAANRQLPEVA
jgi:hypothetical protein